MRIDFEPEVFFPDHPYEAAIVFLGVLPYPERGAGSVGAQGAEFAGSLVAYMRWQARRHKGLAQIRREMNDPSYQPPQWAEFRGRMNRGLKRLRRRAACYSLYGTRITNGFFALSAICTQATNEGRADHVYDMAPNGKLGVAKPEVWERAIPSARRTVAQDVERWAKRFGLNATGKSASEEQKAKDLVRRAVRQSQPVLHLAHAMDEACRETGPSISGWGNRDPALALLMNSEMWIDRAIKTAENWRLASHHPAFPDLTPGSMVRLRRNFAENAP